MRKNKHIIKAIELLGGSVQAVAKLNAYNKDLNVGSYQTVQQWRITGNIPPKYCKSIVALVDGKVTLMQLRPDDWHLIWPELLQKEAA